VDGVNWREVVGNINIDLLLSVDANKLRNFDAIPSLDKLDSSTTYTIYSIYSTQFVAPILKPEDLDSIDWDVVATEARGWGDLWGQIVKPIVDAMSGFFDGFKKAFEKIIDPVKSKVIDIWNTVSGIPGTLSRVLDILRSVVVDPITGALRWVSQNFPSIVRGFQDIVKLITDTIGSIPARFSEAIESAKRVLSGAVDAIMRGLGDVGKIIGDFLSNLPKRFEEAGKVISGFVDIAYKVLGQVADTIKNLPKIISKALEEAGKTLSGWADTVKRILGEVWDRLTQIPTIISSALAEAGKVLSGWVDTAKKVLGEVWEKITGIPYVVADIIARVRGGLEEFGKIVSSAFETFRNVVLSIPRMVEEAGKVVSGFVDTARKILGEIGNALANLPKTFATIADTITRRLMEFRDLVTGGLDVVRKRFEDVGATFSKALDTVRRSLEDAGKVLSTVIDTITKLPSIVKDVFDVFGKAFDEARRKWGEFIETIRRVPDIVREKWQEFVDWISRGIEKVRELLGNLTKVSEVVDKIREGALFVWNVIKDFVTNPWKAIIKYIINPFLGTFNLPTIHVNNDMIASLTDGAGLPPFIVFGGAPEQEQKPWYVQVYEAVKGAIEWIAKWFYDRGVELATWIRDRVKDFLDTLSRGIGEAIKVFSDWIHKLLKPFIKSSSPIGIVWFEEKAPEVEDIFVNALKRKVGVGENIWKLGGELIYVFWSSLLPISIFKIILGVVKEIELKLEPEGLGTKLGALGLIIPIRVMAEEFLRAFDVFAQGYAIGMAMGLANTFMVNLQQLYIPRVVTYYDVKVKEILGDMLTEDEKTYAKINMFLKSVSESALIDYARRMLALSEGLRDEKRLKEVLTTISAHLKLYGLPKWYIEFLTTHPEQLKVPFIDRFGVERKIYLSHIFELPTHSELARMTQRDIFPGVDVMKRIGWIRGWNEDLTTMIYLLTFKYPSFEKLWTFYMRALSGMLWFEPPETIKKVFEAEAEEVGAGKPISTLAIQKALAGPDQVKAMELALNTYFKWIEYSNFSWFTEKTKMYGIPIGREIYSKLGGWTADSWIMVDIAADLPTKIDLRWMSRHGLFIYMAKKFEEAGVKFESYTPLVEAVPKLLESSAATPIQVDLRWFSKLIQATGLHPAWVPIVTVAENIMAIADEMTLLRTGWLNLFKEGMITVEDAERYLAGLLTVSYQVGYWDPVAKVWTSGWINLPVRWLPHERRLLQLRMAMDRILDLYREIYSYIKSGIRTLAITVEDAFSRLKKLVEALNVHYKKLTKAITGVEMEVRVDEEYAKLWLELQSLAQDIEAVERVRTWWSRISGWILYRVAYGWVTEEEIDKLIETVSKFIPLHEIEVEAYKEIAKALLGIARKEAIPSPSTLATFAEYMVIDAKTVEDVLSKYNVPKDYWKLWLTYIAVKPVKSDYKSVINTALKALRYGVISMEDWDKILKAAEAYGFTPVELYLLQMRAELELMIDEARLWRPSLLTLISMIEYVPEAIELLKYYRVDPTFRPIIEKYARVKPLADEVRTLINALYRAKRYTTIPKELEEKVVSIAKSLGVTDEELMIRGLALELQVLADEARVWVPSPSTLATLAEYIALPSKLVEESLRARRVPEEWIAIWLQYITVKPLKADYKAVISTALRALRYRAITEDEWKKILEDAKKYGFTDPEIALLQLRAELERAIEEAKEYVPTPSMLATLAEYIPAVRKYIRDVLEARRIRGVWAEIWTYYIYLRPIVDEVRRWANAMFRLAEYAMIDIKQLDPVFSILKTYGWEDLEITIIQKTIGANLVYHAFSYVIGPPRTLAAMARYTDKAADMAYTRAIRLIDALPVDQNTKNLLKEMWKEYIMSYQAYPEIRSYMTELINAYAYGVLDDKGLDQELDYLRKLGVPEMRLALVKRTAMLRRARVVARYRS
jgi:phage-related protein